MSTISTPAVSAKRAPRERAYRAPARVVSMTIALALIWVFFGFVNPKFLSPLNLSNLAVELLITAVLSLGMLLIIVSGNIDLSIGSGVGLFGGLTVVLMYHYGWSAPAAMAVAVAVALLLWIAMGYFIVHEKIPSFIITLAGLLIFKGLHWLVISSNTVPVTIGAEENALSMLTTRYLPDWLGWVAVAIVWLGALLVSWIGRRRRRVFALELEPVDIWFSRLLVLGQLLALSVLVCNQHRGIPLPAVILVIVALVISVLLGHTRFGRYLYAVGSNEEAAVISGINVQNVVVGAFAIMGVITAIGGFLHTAYAGSSTTTIGQLVELDAIAACVIGGVSLRGGSGTVMGVIFGSLIMASLVNGLFLLAAPQEIQYIARGVILALAVWMDVRLGKRTAS